MMRWPRDGPCRVFRRRRATCSPIRAPWSEREAYARNIENFIGTVKVPVGLAGPLRVNGAHAHGDYYVPLATTEAALVASYSRGAQLLTDAGGARPWCSTRASAARRASRSRRSATRPCSSPGRRRSSRPFRTVAGGDDAARPAGRHAAHRRGQPRLCRLRVHDRRRLGPEHGDDRDRGDLPLHRGAHAGRGRSTGSSRRTCRATRKRRRTRS